VADPIQNRALQLRVAGGDYDAIAKTLEITRKQAEAYVDAELKRLPREGEDEQALDLARLEQMLTALWGKVREGDVKAVGEARECMDRIKALKAVMAEPKEGESPLAKVQGNRAKRLKAA
jgi:hypothetical protein